MKGWTSAGHAQQQKSPRLDFFVNLHFLVQDVSSEATGHLERMDKKEYAHVN